jgi:hypothetical protein
MMPPTFTIELMNEHVRELRDWNRGPAGPGSRRLRRLARRVVRRA